MSLRLRIDPRGTGGAIWWRQLKQPVCEELLEITGKEEENGFVWASFALILSSKSLK